MQAVTQEPAPLTTTSYALLSLLALRPWTTYELAKQMRRSLHWFWPRAESKLYVEPRKLEARGLVRSETRYNGRRPSTVYTITAAGRRALTTWVRRPGNPGPVLEFEALLRIRLGSTFAFQARHLTPKDALYQIEYRDGLKATVGMLQGLGEIFGFAARRASTGGSGLVASSHAHVAISRECAACVMVDPNRASIDSCTAGFAG